LFIFIPSQPLQVRKAVKVFLGVKTTHLGFPTVVMLSHRARESEDSVFCERCVGLRENTIKGVIKE